MVKDGYARPRDVCNRRNITVDKQEKYRYNWVHQKLRSPFARKVPPSRCGCKLDQRELAEYKHTHSRWNRSTTYAVRKIDDYVKHGFRDHNQEAVHLAQHVAIGMVAKRTTDAVVVVS